MDEQARKLKCRFCRWQIAFCVQTGDEAEDIWQALKNHVASRHPDEFNAIQRSLADVRTRLRLLGGDEAVGRLPRRGLGQEGVYRVAAIGGEEPQELCFDVN